jgi:hypothetical protein
VLPRYGFVALNNVLQNLMADVSGRGSDDDHEKFLSQRLSGCLLLPPIAKQAGAPCHARYFNVKTSLGLPEASQFSVTMESGTTSVGR